MVIVPDSETAATILSGRKTAKVMTYETDLRPNDVYKFYPVDEAWRWSVCESLNLTYHGENGLHKVAPKCASSVQLPSREYREMGTASTGPFATFLLDIRMSILLCTELLSVT